MDKLDDFAEQLEGPLGAALLSAGVALEKKLRGEGLSWADLDDEQVADLLITALLEAAPAAYPHLERQFVEEAVRTMGASVKMELTANACGGRKTN